MSHFQNVFHDVMLLVADLHKKPADQRGETDSLKLQTKLHLLIMFGAAANGDDQKDFNEIKAVLFPLSDSEYEDTNIVIETLAPLAERNLASPFKPTPSPNPWR